MEPVRIYETHISNEITLVLPIWIFMLFDEHQLHTDSTTIWSNEQSWRDFFPKIFMLSSKKKTIWKFNNIVPITNYEYNIK
jgi:hypothetical protein